MDCTITTGTVEATREIRRADATATISYRLRRPDDHGRRVTVIERFPDAVEDSITVGDCGQWELLDEQTVAVTADSATSELTVDIASRTMDLDACETTVTVSQVDSHRPQQRSTDAETTDRPLVSDGAGVTPESLGAPETDTATETPVVGAVATGDNTGAVARTTFRAIEEGLDVFVAVDTDDTAGARLAEQLGAVVVHPELTDPGMDELATALTFVAQAHSFEGVIFHGACDGQIDFDESLARFDESEACVDAVLQREQTSVLAGIPAYNEAATIERVVANTIPHVDDLLVVDDGSGDDTAAMARKAGATVVEHDRNRGYGRALKTLFEAAADRSVDHLVILDADGQHDPTDIPRLVDTQRETGADMIIGSRFGETSETEMPLYRRFGLSVITGLLNLSTGNLRGSSKIRDTQSGFRSYSSTAVTSLAEHTDEIDDHMSASVDILYHANKEFDVAEIPVTIDYDVTNASSQNPLMHGLSIVNNILRRFERERPITVLGIPGFLVAVVGSGLGYWVVSDFLSTGTFSVGLVVLSSVFVLGGILSSFTSVILHSLNTHLGDQA